MKFVVSFLSFIVQEESRESAVAEKNYLWIIGQFQYFTQSFTVQTICGFGDSSLVQLIFLFWFHLSGKKSEKGEKNPQGPLLLCMA